MACQERSDGPTWLGRRRAGSQKTPSRSATRNVTKGSAGSWVTEPKRGRAWEAGAGTRGSRARVSARYLMPTCGRGVCSGWPAESEAAAPSSEAHESGRDSGCRSSHEVRLAHRCLGRICISSASPGAGGESCPPETRLDSSRTYLFPGGCVPTTSSCNATSNTRRRHGDEQPGGWLDSARESG